MLFKQPRLLYLLFFTELWERFGFYTIQTILILYVTHALGFSDNKAYIFTAAFNAFLYLTVVPGGILADKLFGFQRSILIGGSILTLGYLSLAMPHESLFYIGLSLLILGQGLFKPNISSIVGTLYDKTDPKRESGFTIFYLGINIGSLIPPLFLGPLTDKFGWNSGFFVAMCGLIISMITFTIGRKYLKHRGDIPANSILLKRPALRTRFNLYFAFGLAITAIIFYIALHAPLYSNLLVIIISVAVVFYLLAITIPLPKVERDGMLACIILIVISIGFWAIYNQTFSSLMLYADRNMAPDFLGLKIGAEFTQAFNPFFIITLAPLLSYLWPALGKYNPSYPMKFALSAFLIALGMFVLALGTQLFNHHGLTSPWWLVLSYAIQTTGELCISPIGLSMITVLAPQRYVGTMMGVWFLAISASFAFSGMLATVANVPQNADIMTSQALYIHAFNMYGILGLALGLLGLILVPKLKKMCSI